MKREPIHLVFHAPHARPMVRCLPVFIVLSLLLVAGAIMFFTVNLPPMLRPRGVGNILYRQDDLTRFRVRQLSALPLRLPSAVDPAAHLPIPKHELPLHPELPLVLPPSQLGPMYDHASAVLDDDYLLELPPEEAAESPQEQKE